MALGAAGGLFAEIAHPTVRAVQSARDVGSVEAAMNDFRTKLQKSPLTDEQIAQLPHDYQNQIAYLRHQKATADAAYQYAIDNQHGLNNVQAAARKAVGVEGNLNRAMTDAQAAYHSGARAPLV